MAKNPSITTKVSVKKTAAVLTAGALTGMLVIGVQQYAVAAPQSESARLVINEVESNGDATDWVEIKNVGDAPADLSGYTVLDNDPVDHAGQTVPLEAGTVLAPGGYFVFVEGTHFKFGLGKADSVTLRDGTGAEVESYSWSGHAEITFGRCPDGTGELTQTVAATPGAKNSCAGDETGPVPGEGPGEGGSEGGGSESEGSEEQPPAAPQLKELTISGKNAWWEGVKHSVLREHSNLLEDTSGLDTFLAADGSEQLYVVDNGTGRVARFVLRPGKEPQAAGFLRVRAPGDAAEGKGPDAEGVSLTAEGTLLIASERDNSNKKVNRNTLLEAVPTAASWQGADVVAAHEWDITALLPQVEANTGIEAVEALPASALAGSFTDERTGKPYVPGSGVLLVAVAVEHTGQVSLFELTRAGSGDATADTAAVVANWNVGLPHAMGLDYLESERQLWMTCDNETPDCGDYRVAVLQFGGDADPVVELRSYPSEVAAGRNTEGFALSKSCVAGARLAYWSTDGVTVGQLETATVPCVAGPADEGGSGAEEPAAEEPQPEQPAGQQPGHIPGAADAAAQGQQGKTLAKTGDDHPLALLAAGGLAVVLMGTGLMIFRRESRRARKRLAG